MSGQKKRPAKPKKPKRRGEALTTPTMATIFFASATVTALPLTFTTYLLAGFEEFYHYKVAFIVVASLIIGLVTTYLLRKGSTEALTGKTLGFFFCATLVAAILPALITFGLQYMGALYFQASYWNIVRGLVLLSPALAIYICFLSAQRREETQRAYTL